jgi:hypothetical protein
MLHDNIFTCVWIVGTVSNNLNYGDDFSDYIEFASENYGDGSLADTNNNNLGNTPAEIQRNQNLTNNNNQDYAKTDKSKGEDLCSGTNCYGKATQKRLEESNTLDCFQPSL